ncbi:unnamed protein product [Owenia fusiformis]|uniref:Uncharacterized protein n=1 Tax=Owenia fusiformis TaxID=6347 RepID=A0A8S4Q640_OWEFU|nr:unnamed protein product [Owenia fusiformis]
MAGVEIGATADAHDGLTTECITLDINDTPSEVHAIKSFLMEKAQQTSEEFVKELEGRGLEKNSSGGVTEGETEHKTESKEKVSPPQLLRSVLQDLVWCNIHITKCVSELESVVNFYNTYHVHRNQLLIAHARIFESFVAKIVNGPSNSKDRKYMPLVLAYAYAQASEMRHTFWIPRGVAYCSTPVLRLFYNAAVSVLAAVDKKTLVEPTTAKMIARNAFYCSRVDFLKCLGDDPCGESSGESSEDSDSDIDEEALVKRFKDGITLVDGELKTLSSPRDDPNTDTPASNDTDQSAPVVDPHGKGDESKPSETIKDILDELINQAAEKCNNTENDKVFPQAGDAQGSLLPKKLMEPIDCASVDVPNKSKEVKAGDVEIAPTEELEITGEFPNGDESLNDNTNEERSVSDGLCVVGKAITSEALERKPGFTHLVVDMKEDEEPSEENAPNDLLAGLKSNGRLNDITELYTRLLATDDNPLMGDIVSQMINQETQSFENLYQIFEQDEGYHRFFLGEEDELKCPRMHEHLNMSPAELAQVLNGAIYNHIMELLEQEDAFLDEIMYKILPSFLETKKIPDNFAELEKRYGDHQFFVTYMVELCKQLTDAIEGEFWSENVPDSTENEEGKRSAEKGETKDNASDESNDSDNDKAESKDKDDIIGAANTVLENPSTSV